MGKNIYSEWFLMDKTIKKLVLNKVSSTYLCGARDTYISATFICTFMNRLSRI